VPHRIIVGTLAVDGWAVKRGGALAGCGPVQSPPLLAVPDVTAHPSTASVPVAALLVRCSAVSMCPLEG